MKRGNCSRNIVSHLLLLVLSAFLFVCSGLDGGEYHIKNILRDVLRLQQFPTRRTLDSANHRYSMVQHRRTPAVQFRAQLSWRCLSICCSIGLRFQRSISILLWSWVSSFCYGYVQQTGRWLGFKLVGLPQHRLHPYPFLVVQIWGRSAAQEQICIEGFLDGIDKPVVEGRLELLACSTGVPFQTTLSGNEVKIILV